MNQRTETKIDQSQSRLKTERSLEIEYRMLFCNSGVEEIAGIKLNVTFVACEEFAARSKGDCSG